MEEKSHPMTPFDEMVGDDRVQMLKAALPYLPRQGQRFLSAYIKATEFRNTLTMFSGPVQAMETCEETEPADPVSMLSEIRPFCCGQTGVQIDQILQAFALVQMINILQES